MKKVIGGILLLLCIVTSITVVAQNQQSPADIKFVRQSVRRFIFDKEQSIPLSALHPSEIIGMPVMYPSVHHSNEKSNIIVTDNKLSIQSEVETATSIWFGGFNPFATYTIELDSVKGKGEIGFEFTDADRKNRIIVTTVFNNENITSSCGNC